MWEDKRLWCLSNLSISSPSFLHFYSKLTCVAVPVCTENNQAWFILSDYVCCKHSSFVAQHPFWMMSPNLGIIPPVLEMSVIIASAVIRALLPIPYSWFPVSQSCFSSARTLGRGDLAQKGRKQKGRNETHRTCTDAQNMRTVTQEPSTEEDVVSDWDEDFPNLVSSWPSELLTSHWGGFFKDLLTSANAYFRGNRAEVPRVGY